MVGDLGLGWRNRIALDDALDEHVDAGVGGLGTYLMLDTTLTQNGLTPEEKGYLRGFVLNWGRDAANEIAMGAYSNPDWLDPPNLVNIFGYHVNLGQYPTWMHMNALQSWPMTTAELDSFYNGLPAAKLAALLGAL